MAITKELGNLAEAFAGGGGEGRQNETTGKLPLFDFIQQACGVWVNSIFILKTKDVKMENTVRTNSTYYIPVNSAKKFYKIE